MKTKLITIEYDEYLELVKFKEAFARIKMCYQEGHKDENDIWTLTLENDELRHFILKQVPLSASQSKYTRVLIK